MLPLVAAYRRGAAPIDLVCWRRTTTSSPCPSPPKEERETAPQPMSTAVHPGMGTGWRTQMRVGNSASYGGDYNLSISICTSRSSLKRTQPMTLVSPAGKRQSSVLVCNFTADGPPSTNSKSRRPSPATRRAFCQRTRMLSREEMSSSPSFTRLIPTSPGSTRRVSTRTLSRGKRSATIAPNVGQRQFNALVGIHRKLDQLVIAQNTHHG